jgi:hypothetical protein
MINDLLLNKTYQEQSRIKSEEISKLNHVGKFIDKDFEVEILGLKSIQVGDQHGVEIMARAWNNKELVGLGDGTVEIERFRIWDPPIYVEDPNGDVKIKIIGIHGRERTVNFREDLVEAIRQTIFGVIKNVGKKNTNIIKGKIGRTTDIFYSATTGNSPLDGYTAMYTSSDWATTHDATTGSFGSTTGPVNVGSYGGSPYEIYRGNFYFNTAVIGTDNISDASIYIVIDNNPNESGNSVLRLLSVISNNTTTLITADYNKNNYGSTAIATDVAYSALGSSKTITITTLGAINKSGITKLGMREVTYDVGNIPCPSGKSNNLEIWAVDKGTTYRPYLTVVHASATSIKKVSGVAYASIKKISGDAIATVKKVAGVA